jgi:hypothetical protein
MVIPPSAHAVSKKRRRRFLTMINLGGLGMSAQVGKNSKRAERMEGDNIQSRCQENITPVFYLASSDW